MADTETITIKDREVLIKKLNETQMMLLVREARLLQSGRHDVARRLQAVSLMLDIVESSVIDPEDQEWLRTLAGTGGIGFGEMLEIAAPLENQVDGEVVAKPVRRGRTTRR